MSVSDNESVYDEQIFPLVQQIIEICKANRIPMVATFEYATERFVSTLIPVGGQSEIMDDMNRLISRRIDPLSRPLRISTTRHDGTNIVEVIL